MKTITRVFTFGDGAVVKASASFAADAMVEAPVRYEGPSDRLAAVFGHELPTTGFSECFSVFLDAVRERGVRTETIEEGEWDSLEL
jgi:hypothetical protein